MLAYIACDEAATPCLTSDALVVFVCVCVRVLDCDLTMQRPRHPRQQRAAVVRTEGPEQFCHPIP